MPPTAQTRFALPRRRGFIILFGARGIVSGGSEPPVQATCPRCGQSAEFASKGIRTWFTIFFVPVFPISGRKEFCQCSVCGAQFTLTARELQSRMAQSEQQSNQQAIGLYNSLRASPANAVTLNQLMTAYASMKEYDQAISAATEFSQALNSSEQCMATLGRVYLAKNEYALALHWLNQAVSRNPQYGEAQYYKGVAHLLSTPPEYPQAIAAARAARAAGHAGADELLKDAETRAST